MRSGPTPEASEGVGRSDPAGGDADTAVGGRLDHVQLRLYFIGWMVGLHPLGGRWVEMSNGSGAELFDRKVR